SRRRRAARLPRSGTSAGATSAGSPRCPRRAGPAWPRSQDLHRVDVLQRRLVELVGPAVELLDAVLQADHAGAEVAGEVDVVDVAEHGDVELAGDLADERHYFARDLRVEA